MNKNNLSFLQKYFSFRKKDRLGFFILLFVIILLFIVDLSLTKLNKKHDEYNFSEFSSEIDSFQNSLIPVEKEYVSRLDSYIIARYDTLNLFKFNPNNTTDKQWLKLGLTKKQIKTINNYKSRGGRFFIKDDFRKIYGIRTKQYQILESFIDLPKELGSEKKEESKIQKLFAFDPNTASENDLKSLGFTSKQINTILNYRNKGGKFKIKEDLKKIYSISEKDYQKYADSIVIEKKEINNSSEKIEPEIIELNSANIDQLKTLPGIGDYFSKGIIKYRDLLGGYYSIEQLKEVYGFKIETYTQIKKYLTVDKNKIKKININFAEFKELISHPYIDENITKSILKYRRKNGFYTSTKQLVNKKIVTSEQFTRLKYYLTVE